MGSATTRSGAWRQHEVGSRLPNMYGSEEDSSSVVAKYAGGGGETLQPEAVPRGGATGRSAQIATRPSGSEELVSTENKSFRRVSTSRLRGRCGWNSRPFFLGKTHYGDFLKNELGLRSPTTSKTRGMQVSKGLIFCRTQPL